MLSEGFATLAIEAAPAKQSVLAFVERAMPARLLPSEQEATMDFTKVSSSCITLEISQSDTWPLHRWGNMDNFKFFACEERRR